MQYVDVHTQPKIDKSAIRFEVNLEKSYIYVNNPGASNLTKIKRYTACGCSIAL